MSRLGEPFTELEKMVSVRPSRASYPKLVALHEQARRLTGAVVRDVPPGVPVVGDPARIVRAIGYESRQSREGDS